MGRVIIQEEKLHRANRYANLLNTVPERDFAFAYIRWLREGAVGVEPERGRLSKRGAEMVKAHIDAMKLWEGAS